MGLDDDVLILVLVVVVVVVEVVVVVRFSTGELSATGPPLPSLPPAVVVFSVKFCEVTVGVTVEVSGSVMLAGARLLPLALVMLGVLVLIVMFAPVELFVMLGMLVMLVVWLAVIGGAAVLCTCGSDSLLLKRTLLWAVPTSVSSTCTPRCSKEQNNAFYRDPADHDVVQGDDVGAAEPGGEREDEKQLGLLPRGLHSVSQPRPLLRPARSHPV